MSKRLADSRPSAPSSALTGAGTDSRCYFADDGIGRRNGPVLVLTIWERWPRGVGTGRNRCKGEPVPRLPLLPGHGLDLRGPSCSAEHCTSADPDARHCGAPASPCRACVPAGEMPPIPPHFIPHDHNQWHGQHCRRGAGLLPTRLHCPQRNRPGPQRGGCFRARRSHTPDQGAAKNLRSREKLRLQ
jgi:hypothetical protein